MKKSLLLRYGDGEKVELLVNHPSVLKIIFSQTWKNSRTWLYHVRSAWEIAYEIMKCKACEKFKLEK